MNDSTAMWTETSLLKIKLKFLSTAILDNIMGEVIN